MKLAKRAALAVGTAIFLVTVSAKASSAASIQLLGTSTSSGDTTFTYEIEYTKSNSSGNQENIGSGSTWDFLDTLVGGTTVDLVASSATVTTTSASVSTGNDPFGTVNNDLSGVVNSGALEFTIVALTGDYQLAAAYYSITEKYNGVTTTFTGTVDVPVVPGTDDYSQDPGVPEPLPVGGSFVAIGLGWWMKRRQAAAQKIG